MGKKGKKKPEPPVPGAAQGSSTERREPQQSTTRPVHSEGPPQQKQGPPVQQFAPQEGLGASQGTQPVHLGPQQGQGGGGRGRGWGRGGGPGRDLQQQQQQPLGHTPGGHQHHTQPQEFGQVQGHGGQDRGRGRGWDRGGGRGRHEGQGRPLQQQQQQQPVGQVVYGQTPGGPQQQRQPQEFGQFQQGDGGGRGRGWGRGGGRGRDGSQGRGLQQQQQQPVGQVVYGQTPGGPQQQKEPQEFGQVQAGRGHDWHQGRGGDRGRGQQSEHQAVPSAQVSASQQPQTGGPRPQQAKKTEPVEKITQGLAKVQLGASDDSALVSQQKIQPGTQGRIIKVESNHLQLSLGKLKEVYHYDVDIQPETPRKFMRPVVEQFRRKRFPTRYPAYDGRKNMITSFMLSANIYDIIEEEIVITEEDGRSKTFKIKVKYANTVDLTPLRDLDKSPVTPQLALQCVDIILRSAPLTTCIPVGRSFFVKPDRIIDLGQGMEMYNGFYQSAIRGWKPLLNVDVAHKAFPKAIRVIDALCELLSGRQPVSAEDLRGGLDRYQAENFEKFMKTLRINYEIPGHPGTKRGYRVNGIGQPPNVAQFQHQERTMTISEYFGTVKNYRLRYPDLPTLWVGSSQRADKILLPLELCTIVEGQALNRKMTEMQTREMIRFAATSTKVRKEKIMTGLQMANYNQNACVREFGISVGNEFQKLDARVLNPPELKYAGRQVKPWKGVWRNEKFVKPVVISKWTIASVVPRYGPRPDDLKRMADMLFRAANEVGVRFDSPAQEPFIAVQPRQDLQSIITYFKGQKVKGFDLIFVVVPNSGPQYSYVKQAAEISVGCLTQCIKSDTVGRRMNPQTALNILLKVNSKLNGVNHTLAIAPPLMRRPVMIMGADVTHPGPDAQTIPSVAAVTASHDPKAFQYNICWRLQPPRVEIIVDLEAIVVEQLLFFNRKTNCKPEAIVFFRDGVSEGQFEEVKKAEIRAIRSACKKLQAQDYEPKITFVVVQKRHHTRLFPLNASDSEDKNMNVPAGTCVDKDITHPFMQDFYLVSHASIQGVAKPTKYCTLWDDNNLDNDQVEQLAYYLCHMFTRCNRSVSYPAPTYYAHLAAARAKVYIENDTLNMSALMREFERYQIKDEIRKGLPMFFV